MPSYTARLPAGQTLDTYGVSRISELPQDMVQDCLVVMGESETGDEQFKIYVLERDPQMNRVWVSQHLPEGVEIDTHFRPLFILPSLLKKFEEDFPGASKHLDNSSDFVADAVVRVLARGLPE